MVKVIGQGQTSGMQRSILGARLCQSKVFVCVSVISGAYADYCADAVDQLLIKKNPPIQLFKIGNSHHGDVSNELD